MDLNAGVAIWLIFEHLIFGPSYDSLNILTIFFKWVHLRQTHIFHNFLHAFRHKFNIKKLKTHAHCNRWTFAVFFSFRNLNYSTCMASKLFYKHRIHSSSHKKPNEICLNSIAMNGDMHRKMLYTIPECKSDSTLRQQ